MKIDQITKRIVLTIFSIFLLAITPTINAQNRIWTIEDCFLYAIENNIQIKQSLLDVQYSEVDLQQSKLNLLPNLNGNASASYNWGRVLDRTRYTYSNQETNQANFGLDANMRLFGGLQYQNRIKKAKLDFLASQYATDKIKDDISLLLTQAYLTILYNKELLKVATEQVAITQEQIKRTEKLVEAGKLAMGSLLEIQAQGAREEINEINYENSLALSYLDLLQILDLPADADFEIEVPVFDTELTLEVLPISQIYEVALGTQALIKNAEVNVESAYKNVAIAQGALSPVLSLQSGWNTNFSNQYRKVVFDTLTGNIYQTDVIPFGDQFADNQSRYLGIGLSIPIFNGYQAASNVARARIAASNAEYTYDLTKNTLRKNIEQAYYDAQAAFKSYQATQKSLSSFSESFRYTEQKFTVGMATSVDYNLAKTQLTAVESELVRARYDYIFKTKILDFYMGRPITLN
ncbi:MAG: TolC family protein [Bacteroidales bacterium]|nr:TolC family protein [Bacteroidales bacterium]